jgi:hypothetical protein
MNKPIKDLVQEAVQRAWSDATSALQSVEEEVGRWCRQVKERAELQHGSEEIQRLMAELVKRLQQNSEAMEQGLQESLRGFVAKVKTPLFEELIVLRTQAEQLSSRVETLLRRRSGEQESSAPSDRSDPDSNNHP